ncbi:hypothetical protein ACFVXE_12065 [Streptomyces sp. NPDC058231]|uniref:hypothetical protein n=1 Tax=unclassified Streptomyces TaxID=2593676 RepID=UPI0036EA3BDE
MTHKRSAMYGQLPLSAALLFGICTAYTAGHPAELGGCGSAPATGPCRPYVMTAPAARLSVFRI